MTAIGWEWDSAMLQAPRWRAMIERIDAGDTPTDARLRLARRVLRDGDDIAACLVMAAWQHRCPDRRWGLQNPFDQLIGPMRARAARALLRRPLPPHNLHSVALQVLAWQPRRRDVPILTTFAALDSPDPALRWEALGGLIDLAPWLDAPQVPGVLALVRSLQAAPIHALAPLVRLAYALAQHHPRSDALALLQHGAFFPELSPIARACWTAGLICAAPLDHATRLDDLHALATATADPLDDDPQHRALRQLLRDADDAHNHAIACDALLTSLDALPHDAPLAARDALAEHHNRLPYRALYQTLTTSPSPLASRSPAQLGVLLRLLSDDPWSAPDACIDSLIACLTHPDPDVRTHAVVVLHQRAPEHLTPHLNTALTAGPSVEALRILDALGTMRTLPDLCCLTLALEHPDPRVRLRAAGLVLDLGLLPIDVPKRDLDARDRRDALHTLGATHHALISARDPHTIEALHDLRRAALTLAQRTRRFA